MDKADLAIAISVLSFAVAAGGQVWQILAHLWTGPKVEVRLIPKIAQGWGTILTGPDQGWGTAPGALSTKIDPLRIELACVRVTNTGRTSISISDVELDFGRLRWWSRRSRYSAASHQLELADGVEDRVIRLEPGEFRHVVFELWTLVKSARIVCRDPIKIRASARPAGGKQKRSSRRRQWVIAADQYSFVPSSRLDDDLGAAEAAAYRALWLLLNHDEASPMTIDYVWRTMQPLLHLDCEEEFATRIRQALQDHPDSPGLDFPAIRARTAYLEELPQPPALRDLNAQELGDVSPGSLSLPESGRTAPDG